MDIKALLKTPFSRGGAGNKKEKAKRVGLGLYLSTHGIALAWVNPPKPGMYIPRLREVRFIPFEGGFDASNFDSELKKALLSQGLVSRPRCFISLSPHFYRLFKVPNPKVEAGRRYASAKWAIKDLIDFPLQNCVYDLVDIALPPGCVPLGSASEEKKETSPQDHIFIAAAQQDALQKLLKPLHDNAYKIGSIIPTPFALRSVLLLLPPSPFKVTLHRENGFILMSLYYQKDLLAHRQVTIESPFEENTVTPNPERLEKWLQSVRATYEYFRKQFQPCLQEEGSLPLFFLPHRYQEDAFLSEQLLQAIGSQCHFFRWGDFLNLKREEAGLCFLPPTDQELGRAGLAICAALMEDVLIMPSGSENEKKPPATPKSSEGARPATPSSEAPAPSAASHEEAGAESVTQTASPASQVASNPGQGPTGEEKLSTEEKAIHET